MFQSLIRAKGNSDFLWDVMLQGADAKFQSLIRAKGNSDALQINAVNIAAGVFQSLIRAKGNSDNRRRQSCTLLYRVSIPHSG